jgi:hypothetical protein
MCLTCACQGERLLSQRNALFLGAKKKHITMADTVVVNTVKSIRRSMVKILLIGIAYIVIAIFLNPLFRRVIREDDSSLPFKEHEGSILFSIGWPIAIAGIIVSILISALIFVLRQTWVLGNKLFKDKK